MSAPLQSLLGLWLAPGWRADPLPLPAGPGHLRLEGLPGLGTRDIPPGLRLRLVGPSGAGKSSFLALLQRHADPPAGRILLDGVDLRELDRGELRRAVALVPQRPFLLRGTVAENLTLTAPASEAAMAEVLALVGLDARLAPSTDLGEDGQTLSGGERQRLCLARALLAPFRVLILDEALSEVDAPTARAIMARIADRFPGRSVIVVTHGHEAALGPFDAELAIGGPA
jgi:ATP-binding cassette subfamily B protein